MYKKNKKIVKENILITIKHWSYLLAMRPVRRYHSHEVLLPTKKFGILSSHSSFGKELWKEDFNAIAFLIVFLAIIQLKSIAVIYLTLIYFCTGMYLRHNERFKTNQMCILLSQ
jgi:hypothetical protein